MTPDFDDHADEAVALANSPRHESIIAIISRNEIARFLRLWQAGVLWDAQDDE